MSVTINDLQPKPFIIKIGDLELNSKPIRLSHALMLVKVGKIFDDASNASIEDIESAQKSLDKVFGDLVPELAGVELDMNTTIVIIEQMMNQITPDDNKELVENKVKIDTDPKV
jgi:hypothetical protein